MFVIANTRGCQFTVIAVRRTLETTPVVGESGAAIDIRRIALTYLFGRAFGVAIDTGRLGTVAVGVEGPYTGTEALGCDTGKDSLAVQTTEPGFTRITRILKRTRAKITTNIELASVLAHSGLTRCTGPETCTLTPSANGDTRVLT